MEPSESDGDLSDYTEDPPTILKPEEYVMSVAGDR